MSYIPPSIPLRIFAPCKTNSILNRIPIWCYSVTQQVKNELHWHNFTQIWYTVSGSYYHTFNGKRTLLSSGDLSIIFPYSVHAIDTSKTNLDNARIIAIYLPNDIAEKLHTPFRPLTHEVALFDKYCLSPFVHFSKGDKNRADMLFEDILSEFSKNSDMNFQSIFNNIASIFELCIKYSESKMQRCALKSTYEQTSHINFAVDYLTTNHGKKLPLSEVSSLALMSRRSFSDKFKAVTGRTYHNYLINVRLSEAIMLLRHTEKRISDIAQQCGFSNSGHFTKICADMSGMSPVAMRRYTRNWLSKYGGLLYDDQLLRSRWLFNELSDEEITENRRFATGEFLL